MARPRKEINWTDVEKLCVIQCTAEEIASFCGVCADTLATACLRDHGISFSEYFEQKRGDGKISLRRAQYQLAVKGNPTMLIWLGKQLLEQRDKQSTEVSGPQGKPVEVRDVSDMPDDQLEAKIDALLAKRKPKA